MLSMPHADCPAYNLPTPFFSLTARLALRLRSSAELSLSALQLEVCILARYFWDRISGKTQWQQPGCELALTMTSA